MSERQQWGAWVRAGVLALGILFLSRLAWKEVDGLLRHQPLGIDFLPMWAAAREAFVHPAKVYNFVSLTIVQQPLLANFRGLRPFVYPPTTLLALAPFSLAPFQLANLLWTAMGAALILWTMAPLVKSPRLLALLAMVLSPASVLVLVTGQVTFMIAALGVTGLLSLKTRPRLAGVLFGLAAVIKPQALVFLPLALMAIGGWTTLAAAAATAACAALASIVVFGYHAWLEWFAAVPRFEHFVLSTPGLERGMITPTALGLSIGLDPGAQAAWRLAFAIGGGVIVWKVFRKTEDPARRLTALFGGALFISPYAMHYDAALLAPAATLMLTHRAAPRAWLFALGAGALLCCAALPHWGAAAVTAFVLVVALTPETAFQGRFTLPALERVPQKWIPVLREERAQAFDSRARFNDQAIPPDRIVL